jgi:hypothetical protein
MQLKLSIRRKLRSYTTKPPKFLPKIAPQESKLFHHNNDLKEMLNDRLNLWLRNNRML